MKIEMTMTFPSKFLILILVLSGCAENTICESHEQLLYCSDSSLTHCDGYLKDKPVDIKVIEGALDGQEKNL